jgi:hypothetical protein
MIEVRSLLAFGFISPWLLVGGLALSAVPLVIHLLRRRQYVERPWAAMQFLQAALRSQARRVRLESLAVLLVRTMLVGLAAVAIAQPYFDEDEARLESHSGRERTLVIDTSLSMSAGPRGATALDRAHALATRIVESALPGDAFRLIQVRRTPPLAVIQHPATDRHSILQQIRSLEGTQQRADVAAALRIVQSSLEQSHVATRREVIIVSDFQGSNWMPVETGARQELTELLEAIADGAELTCLHVSGAMQGNLSLNDMKAVPTAPPEIGIVAVEVSVENSGTQPAKDVPIEVFAGQQRVGSATITVPAGESTSLHIPLASFSPVEGVLTAQIPDDELMDDNHRWLTLPARRPLEVLLVGGHSRTAEQRGDTDFVELALAPGRGSRTPGITATVIDIAELPNADLPRFGCIYLCDVPAIDEATAAQLNSYVAAGGGLVIALGEQVQPAGYRILQHPQEEPLLPGIPIEVVGGDSSSESPVRFAPGDYRHPVIKPFAGNPDSGLLTTEIDRYWKVEIPAAGSGDVVLSFSTGDPAIVERTVGRGRVLLVTTPLDDSWSNWALWPSFLPIVHELTRAATAGKDAEHAKLVGDPFVVELPADNFGVSIELRTPTGATSELRKSVRPGGSWTASTIAEKAGVHLLTLGPPLQTVESYAVNIDPAESRLKFLDAAALSDLVPRSAFRSLEDWQPSTPALLLSSQHSRLSRTLLLVVLGLMLVDQLMTWRFRIGLAALALLLCVAPAATVGGRGGILMALVAVALLAALVLTLFVRSRMARGIDSR